MMRRAAVTFIWIYILLLTTVAEAGTPFSKDVWLNETNEPVKVNCLVKDNIGFMWLGTEDGVYRYNGSSFTKVQTGALKDITALAVADNRIYIGAADGRLGVWSDEEFRLKELQGAVPTESISSIYVVMNNVLLLSTVGQGLFWVQDDVCTSYTTEDGLSDDYVYTVLSPSKHILLAATDQGISQVDVSKGHPEIKKFSTANGLPDNIVRVIRPMKDKCWSWIGTHQGGVALYCSDAHAVWVPKTNTPWQWGQINDILPVDTTKAWVSTEKGYLLHIELHSDSTLDITPHYFAGQKIYHLLTDATGNVWCATNTGLKEVIAEYVSSVRIPEPYSLQKITALYCDMDDHVWYTQNEQLYCFRLSEAVPQPKLVYTSKSPVTQIYFDRNNVLWMGTFGDGLWYSEDHQTFHKVTGVQVLEHERILDIAGTGDKMWVAGLNGIEELNIEPGNKVRIDNLHTKNAGVGSDYVYRVFPDERGGIWMATDGAGVCLYRNGSYMLWDSTSGMDCQVAYGIAEDTHGNIWVTTLNKGILVYDGVRWQSIGADKGLLSLQLSSIAAMDNGGMLVVHDKGIDEWHPHDRLFRHFERRLGVGIDTVSTMLNLAATDTAGNVYIPYQDGLVCFGKHSYSTSLTPDIHIRSLNTIYRQTKRDDVTFPYAENHITFNYEGINYANPEHLYYRYKLEGYSNEWIMTRDESVTFPQLPSGDYRFVVQVSMNSMFASIGETSQHFVIAKPFWLQLWFILLVIAMVWGAAYTYIRIREKNLRKLSSLQRERMMFEYEHLRSQVNPHFLFNSLNTLTGLIEDDTEHAMQYTRQLSDLYRNMLSHKDKDLIPLAEEWEILENYIYIQKSRFEDALQLEEHIPERLKKTKKVVPMALQLLVENAIKHNIVSRAKPLVIRFDADDDYLTITNNYQPKLSKEKGAGLGLVNIHKRYELHTKREVAWGVKNNEFIVTIPLI